MHRYPGVASTDARVASAVLAPGQVGLYRVTIAIPDAGPTGDAVAVTIEVEGQVSPAATVAIRR